MTAARFHNPCSNAFWRREHTTPDDRRFPRTSYLVPDFPIAILIPEENGSPIR